MLKLTLSVPPLASAFHPVSQCCALSSLWLSPFWKHCWGRFRPAEQKCQWALWRNLGRGAFHSKDTLCLPVPSVVTDQVQETGSETPVSLGILTSAFVRTTTFTARGKSWARSLCWPGSQQTLSTRTTPLDQRGGLCARRRLPRLWEFAAEAKRQQLEEDSEKSLVLSLRNQLCQLSWPQHLAPRSTCAALTWGVRAEPCWTLTSAASPSRGVGLLH